MSHETELFDAFILVQCDIVLILGIPHSAISICMLVESTSTNNTLYALDAIVNGVLGAGHIDLINASGCEQVTARLELLVVGSGSKTEASRGPSEL
eukprot:8743066-Pyramimonas_sp.AAC.1